MNLLFPGVLLNGHAAFFNSAPSCQREAASSRRHHFPLLLHSYLFHCAPPRRLLTLHLLFYPFTSSSLRHGDCLRHSVLPSPIVSAEVQCGCCLPKPAAFLSRPHPFTPLQPICPESLFFFLQHLVFSLYHRWSTFHAGLLHALMPSLCVYAVCVLFVSPACHSETHWLVWGLSGSTQTFHSAGCHRGQAIKDYTSERESELSAGQ